MNATLSVLARLAPLWDSPSQHHHHVPSLIAPAVSAWSPAQLLLVTVSLVTLWDAAVGRVNLDEDDKGNGWALLRRNRAAVRQPAAEESDSAIRGLAAALSLSLAVSKASLSAAAEGSVAVAAVQRCLGRRGTWDAQVRPWGASAARLGAA